MRRVCLLALFLLSVVWGASAQSLKPESPFPLKAGINQGTSDSLVGTHYWYFYVQPGSSTLKVRFKRPTTILGANINTVLTITVTDDKKTWKVVRTVNGSPNGSEATFTSEKLDKRVKIIVSVAPPNQNMLRMGGDYEIEASGDVAFDDEKSTGDLIVRTYEPKIAEQAIGDYGTVRFNADGTIDTANGFNGNWKLFDRDNRIYVVKIMQYRYSLQYRPGYGLVKPDEPNMIVFQELRH